MDILDAYKAHNTALTISGDFSMVFLVVWLLILVLAVTFAFYFDRVVALLVTLMLRLIAWRRLNATLQIESLKMSFVGGRLLFKNLVYVGTDATICLYRGSITWRYWLRHTRPSKARIAELYPEDEASGAEQRLARRPARFFMEAEGVEMFVYNRSQAYEDILQFIAEHDVELRDDTSGILGTEGGTESEKPQVAESSPQQTAEKISASLFTPGSSAASGTSATSATSGTSATSATSATSDTSATSSSESDASNSENEATKPLLRHIFPIQFAFSKGAVVVGNNTTPSVLVAHTTEGSGCLDFLPPSTPLDRHSMCLSTGLGNLSLHLKPNMDYLEPYEPSQKSETINTFEPSNKQEDGPPNRIRQFLSQLRHDGWKLRSVRPLLRRSKSAYVSAEKRWKGLSRYVESTEAKGTAGTAEEYRFAVEEYAMVPNVFACTHAEISYTVDVPGVIGSNSAAPTDVSDPSGVSAVPEMPSDTPPTDKISAIVNAGQPAPRHEMTLRLTGTVVNYGPWTLRQQEPLLRAMFPRMCRDQLPAAPGRPGQRRRFTKTVVVVEFVDDLLLRMPTREPSKDDGFLDLLQAEFGDQFGMADDAAAGAVRPYGWVELKARERTTITAELGLLPGPAGTENAARVFFDQPEIRTSVNHGLLFRAESHTLELQFDAPRHWNGCTVWEAHNESVKGDMFILREHVTLLTDLLTDVSGEVSGAARVPYEQFSAFAMLLTWKLQHYALYLNVNDGNIINSPTDFEDNVFLAFSGSELTLDVDVPPSEICPRNTTVRFSLGTEQFDLALRTPSWHTAASFMPCQQVGRAYGFSLTGRYTYYPGKEPGNCDAVALDCSAQDVTLYAYGEVIRYLMQVRDNYFGDHVHFRTLDEFSASRAETEAKKRGSTHFGTEPAARTEAQSPELDVLLTVDIRRGCLVLPGHIYSSGEHIGLHMPRLEADLRFTNYYMDMHVDVQPVRLRHYAGTDPRVFADRAAEFRGSSGAAGSSAGRLDGLIIAAHRMFGRPPDEPTYLCKWDMQLGALNIDGGFEFLSLLTRAVQCLALGYSDAENALQMPDIEEHDILFLTVATPEIRICVADSPAGSGGSSDTENDQRRRAELVIRQPRVRVSNLANHRYSGRTDVTLPEVHFAVWDGPKLTAYIETGLRMTDFVEQPEMERRRIVQELHVKYHDGPFHRLPFLVAEELRDAEYYSAYGSVAPSFSIPGLPAPLTAASVDILLGKSVIATDAFAQLLGLGDAESELESLENRRRDWPASATAEPDVRPSYTPDPRFGYDSFVGTVRPVKGFVTPEAADWATELAAAAAEVPADPEALLDALQMQATDHLAALIAGQFDVTNVRFVCPSVCLQYGAFGRQPSGCGPLSESVRRLHDHVLVEASDLQIAVGSVVAREAGASIPWAVQDAEEGPRKQLDLAVVVGTVSVAAMEADSRSGSAVEALFVDPTALEFRVQDVEVGFDGAQSSILFGRVRGIELSVQEARLPWFTRFATVVAQPVPQWANRICTYATAAANSRAAIVHELSAASVAFNIQHDPPALTKPSYITRVSPNHMRSNDSWKIITRIRHVLQSLPAEWVAQLPKRIAEAGPASSAQARAVQQVFSQWRSWEFVDIGNNFFFQLVFPMYGRFARPETRLGGADLRCDSCVIRCLAEDGEDYLRLDAVAVALDTARLADRPAYVEEQLRLSLGIDSVGCRVGIVLLRTALAVMKWQAANITAAESQSEPEIESKSKSETASAYDVIHGVKTDTTNTEESEIPKSVWEKLTATLGDAGQGVVAATLGTVDFRIAVGEAVTQLLATDIVQSATMAMQNGRPAVLSASTSWQLLQLQAGLSPGARMPLRDIALSVSAADATAFGIASLISTGSHADIRPAVGEISVRGGTAALAAFVSQLLDSPVATVLADMSQTASSTASCGVSRSVSRTDSRTGPRSASSAEKVKSSDASNTGSGFSELLRCLARSFLYCSVTAMTVDFGLGSAVRLVADVAYAEMQVVSAAETAFGNVWVEHMHVALMPALGNPHAAQYTLAKFSVEQVDFFVKSRPERAGEVAVARLEVSECQLLLPDLVSAVVYSQKHVATLGAEVAELTTLATRIATMAAEFRSAAPLITTAAATASATAATAAPLLWSAMGGINIISVIVLVGSGRYVLQVADSRVSASNFAADSAGGVELVPLYGAGALPRVVGRLEAQKVPEKCREFLDFTLQLHVENTGPADATTEGSGKSFQLKCDHFWVCLSEPVVAHFLGVHNQCAARISALGAAVADTASALSASVAALSAAISVLSPNPQAGPTASAASAASTASTASTPNSFLGLAPRTAVHVLVHNICLGWIFDAPRYPLYPGVIVGCDKVYAVAEKHLAKLTLVETFATVAGGDSSANFHIRNRDAVRDAAIMPQMVLKFVSAGDGPSRSIIVDVDGQQLRVALLSCLPLLIDNVFVAVAELEGEIERLPRHSRQQPAPQPLPTVAERRSGAPKPLALGLSKLCAVLEGAASFAGARIELYESQVFDRKREAPPTPSAAPPTPSTGSNGGQFGAAPCAVLQSPAVRFAVMFTRESAQRNNELTLELLISPSENTLYPTCVVPIVQMAGNLVAIVRRSKSSATSAAPVEVQPGSPTADLAELLTGLNLSLAVHVGSQRVRMSCEPTAKIVADVGVSRLDFQASFRALSDGGTEILASASAEQLSGTLKHIYSRETSGSVSIAEVSAAGQWRDPKAPVVVVMAVKSVELWLNLKQAQDPDLFFDIWKAPKSVAPGRHFSVPGPARTESSGAASSLPMSLAETARRAGSTYTFPWRIDATLEDASVKVGLGQSLGRAELAIPRAWLLSRKARDRTQTLTFGLGRMEVSGDGRLSGQLVVSDVWMRSGISWPRVGGDVPRVALAASVGSVEARVSFDYHYFFVAAVSEFRLGLYNQPGSEPGKPEVFGRDKLIGLQTCKYVKVYKTLLATANFMDIYNMVKRMKHDSKLGYRAVLEDGAGGGVAPTEENGPTSPSLLQRLEEVVGSLEIRDDILIHIYPNTLLDSQVIVVRLHGIRARFSEKSDETVRKNELYMQLRQVSVALSETPAASRKSSEVGTLPIPEFMRLAETARGASLLFVPSLVIEMTTWQKLPTFEVEFLFSSGFDGKVEVRWNIGSINYIRDIWTTFAKSLSSRLVTLTHSDAQEDVPLFQTVNIEEKLQDVELDKKYVYIPRAPPQIATPHLKELGTATPPLEWFGLHRDSFPGAVHQIVIVGLQKVVKEAEAKYYKALQKVSKFEK